MRSTCRGRFRLNTISSLLTIEHDQKTLHCMSLSERLHFYSHFLVVHRLDRLTSGLVIIGKNKFISSKIAKQIESHQVSKYYLSKVVGQFPEYVLRPLPSLFSFLVA